MERTAKHNGTLVYIVMVARDISYALISHNQDKSRAFKVDLNELTDLNFTPEKYSEEQQHELQ